MSNQSPWFIVPTKRPNATCRLFCFPYAGGSAASFRVWSQKLPPHIELIIVQLPGRENRMNEPFIKSLPEVVACLYREIGKIKLGPYIFFGHSVGALIAYELTRMLQENGFYLPIKLIVGGKRAPHIPINRTPLHELEPAVFKNKLIEFNGTPKIVLETPELYDLFVPRLKADFEINETYRYQKGAPIQCPIDVLVGNRDAETSSESIEAWQQHTVKKFAIYPFDGDHFFIHALEDQFLNRITKLVNEAIEDELMAV